jgi:hypothetical protein
VCDFFFVSFYFSVLFARPVESGQTPTCAYPNVIIFFIFCFHFNDNVQVPTKVGAMPAANPFAVGGGSQPNPFQPQPAPRPSINELRHQQNFGVVGSQPQQPLLQQQQQPSILQPAPAGAWGPAPTAMQSGSGVTSPTFNPFLAKKERTNEAD